jgi:hypothetical protein
VSGEFIITSGGLSGVIPSHKCHSNLGPIVNSYGATAILKSR